jgi:hypothetical protein
MDKSQPKRICGSFDETTVNLTQQEEGTIVAGGFAWRLGVAVELMEDSSSPEYMEVRCLDELKVEDNIRQGGVCCVCVKYCVLVMLR